MMLAPSLRSRAGNLCCYDLHGGHGAIRASRRLSASRRGISVVATMSAWPIQPTAVGTEPGFSVTNMASLLLAWQRSLVTARAGRPSTFRPDETLSAGAGLTANELVRLAAPWRHLPAEPTMGVRLTGRPSPA